MKERDYIGDFFKAELDDFEPSLSFDELEIIDKIQANNRFYKFSPYNFNIYYAFAILSGFLLTLGCFTHYIFKQQNEVSTIETKIHKPGNSPAPILQGGVRKNEINQEVNSSEISKNNTKINNQTNTTNQRVGIVKNENTEMNSSTVTNNTIITQPNIEVLNTNATKPTVITDSIPKKKEIKPIRKQIFIVKRDTIYKKDTLKVKRK